MRKHIISIILLLFIFTLANAQVLVQSEEHELSTLLNPWTQIQNAAGLGLSPVVTHGVTELGYNISGGDYHRAQEGNERNGLDFYSERFDKLNENWAVWGSFNFIMDREKNRKWSDVFNTYNNNPYLFGSSIPGSYDRQLFDFHAKISTQKRRLNFGLGIDYCVGDLSRLRDPRSRVYLADYAALPSVTFNLNKEHVIGLNLLARFQKEKMPNITTVQDDPNLKYYSFLGMENADGIIAGFKGFQRQFVSNLYGFDLQYGFSSEKSRLLLSGGVFTQEQQILENLKQSPGTFNSVNYRATAIATSEAGSLLLNLKLNANMKKGAADENLQELITVRDTATGVASQQWVTLFTYKNRYINNTYDISFNFDIRNLFANKTDYSWMAGIQAGMAGFENQYYLPFSEMAVNRANAGAYGHIRLLNKNNHRLTVKGNVNYEVPVDTRLQLTDGVLEVPGIGASTFRQGTYDVATNVILPDFDYYNAQVMKLGMETKYSFPLSFKKSKMSGFVKLHYQHLTSNTQGNWMNAGVSVGIMPL